MYGRVLLTCAIAFLSVTPALSQEAQELTPRPQAVVALVDTGINPYHATFRDESPHSFRHPSEYIPGYPEDAVALPITLDAESYAEAYQEDCDLWRSVQPGKLYWFPGTKIVGGITFQAAFNRTCSSPSFNPGILDHTGAHGTMVASRAASVEYGACRECLIVSAQGFTTASVDWAADNAGWIDAQSNSWGPFLPGWAPVGTGSTSDPAFVRAVEDAALRQPSFWASGNGAGTRLGVLGHPTTIDPRMTPSIFSVGGHDSGYLNTWPDFPPLVVSDSCASWAASNRSMDESRDSIGGGTSGASPFAAGGGVRLMLEARAILGDMWTTGIENGAVARGPAGLVPGGPLADGVFTAAEWRELLLKAASPRPKRQFEDGPPCGAGLYGPTPVKWTDVPPQYPEYIHIGYGAVDDEARGRAFAVLRGTQAMPDRSITDAFFLAEGAVRGALHGIYDG
jgi:hypothetical protein